MDFSDPELKLERMDSDEIRKKIIGLSYTEWRKMGFSKGTLNYIRKKIEQGKTFTLNKHVKSRLDTL